MQERSFDANVETSPPSPQYVASDWPQIPLVAGEKVPQPTAAGALEVGLRKAAIGPARRMRAVPRFRGIVVAQPDAVSVSDHRRALRAARPVLASAILAGRERGAVRLRSGQHVMAVRRVAATIDDIALLAQRGLLAQVVGTVQFSDVLGDYGGFGIAPRSLAEAVAGVHPGLTIGSLRRKIRAPCFCTGARRLR